MQSVMACLNFQNTLFREHVLMAAFIHFRSTCTCFHSISKWMLSSLSNRAIFFGIFLFKELPKKIRTFIMFSWLRLRHHSPKTFLYWRNSKILISLKRRTLVLTIIYIKLISIKSSFTFEERKTNKKQKKIFREVYWGT